MRTEKEPSENVSVRIPIRLLKFIDCRVGGGIFDNRSHGIRRLVEIAISEYEAHQQSIRSEGAIIRESPYDKL